MTARRFLFLMASARQGGNSEALARRVAEALAPGVLQDWRDLTAVALPPFENRRHGGAYGPVTGPAADLAQGTLAASDIVLVAPLYWYGLPAPAKLYLDHWSHWMRWPDLQFKAGMRGKSLWLVMAHSGSTPAEIAPAVEGLRLSGLYMGMDWGGVLLADANAPGDWRADAGAVAFADRFFGA